MEYKIIETYRWPELVYIYISSKRIETYCLILLDNIDPSCLVFVHGVAMKWSADCDTYRATPENPTIPLYKLLSA